VNLSVADRLAILDIITRADNAASRRDADSYAALFTDDAVLDGTQGRHAGRDALRASVGPIWAAEGPATLHLTLNPVVQADAGDRGDRAIARSIMLIIDPAQPPRITAAALITQMLVRVGDNWLISRRTVAPADTPTG
jgi:uncharacterized protein (TIGR02246 family)